MLFTWVLLGARTRRQRNTILYTDTRTGLTACASPPMRRRGQSRFSPNSIQARLGQVVGAHDDMELHAHAQSQGALFGHGAAIGEGGVQPTSLARQGASWRSLLVA